ncbi:MAG: type II/IV secretion system protein [Candidatus Doudnabacteria bacterium]|nr:type II/IV secretion system protein [Candidatus Doudnabacteria bacterium]
MPYFQQLKEYLTALELLTSGQFDDLQKRAEQQKLEIEEILVNEGVISDERIGQLKADILKYKFVNLRKESIPNEVLNLIPEKVARQQRVIAFERGPEGVKLAMVTPSDLEVATLMQKKIGEKIIVYMATPRDIKNALEEHYRRNIQEEFEGLINHHVNAAVEGESRAGELPVIRIVDTLIEYAYNSGASDIHIEPQEDNVIARFRIDGILHDVIRLPLKLHNLLVTRIKVLARLRTDEHFSAQDGKVKYAVGKEKMDLRVSILPISNGEKVVMRILAEQGKSLTLESLGLTEGNLNKVKDGFQRTHGITLATGPTGSGKTTTLYAILKILNTRDVNIATIEDPIEYTISGINQIQVNPKTNLTFAEGLKSIMRQDPNIIMVGEIRDNETAGMAINSAMTGHLVLSTIHTNDAATTLPRLLNMEMEPFLIASSVNVIIAQRLVRKICLSCVESHRVKTEEIKKDIPEDMFNKYLGSRQEVTVYQGKGCAVCSQIGYKGRIGIFEVLEVDDTIRRLITERANASDIKKQAIKNGMTTMFEDGLQKVLNGLTSLEEVLRVMRE